LVLDEDIEFSFWRVVDRPWSPISAVPCHS
jgi:hypothetical protein